MRTNTDRLPRERRYELLKEMQDRVKKSGEEAFTLNSLSSTSEDFGRNRTNLRKDLEQLAVEGLVRKDVKLNPIVTYTPDGPGSYILTGRILGNFMARLNDLVRLRLLAIDNSHFECQRCGRFFTPAHVCLAPLFPVRVCAYCLSNSKLSLIIKTRPCIIQ